MDLDYEAFAVFELSFSDFDSITNLNLKLWIISDCLLESIIVKKVPLILIIVLVLIEMRLGGRIDLEHLYFFEAWAYIFRDQLAGLEFLIQESISEHHLAPNIEIFP